MAGNLSGGAVQGAETSVGENEEREMCVCVRAGRCRGCGEISMVCESMFR